MPSPDPVSQSQRLVWWVLWAAFQIGIVFIYIVIGLPTPVRTGNEPTLWQLGFLPVLVSGAVRWSFLPAIKDAVKALPIFIVGTALAEMTCFLGIFIFPSHKLELFLVSAIGIFQFIPVYFGRYFEHPEQ